MKVTTLTGGAVLYQSEKGAMRVSQVAPGIAYHACVGIIPASFAEIVAEDGDRILGKFGRCTFFVDNYDVKHLDTGFREHMGRWFASHRDHTILGHMLQRSRVLEMAVALANVFSRTQFTKLYSSVPEWERACRKELPGFRRDPVVWEASDPA